MAEQQKKNEQNCAMAPAAMLTRTTEGSECAELSSFHKCFHPIACLIKAMDTKARQNK